ncbi:GhoT/OrtT family toxin [Hafnia alvei]|uniref:GhoT/OrtT family toxin n=1 Tax=Hafnia alvei TaxID=569 RepID=UPI000E000E42|nr:GhoT/OrtT family toxin [Hafnia alvei]STQ71112.1 Protein of uncharacterised function (DUF2566) [Hafnia alvei]
MYPAAWAFIKTVYLIGSVISALLTFKACADPSLKIRLFTAILIGLTWPMSFPIVLLFWAFM